MKKSRKIVLVLFTVTILTVLSVFGWFVSRVFEGECPGIQVDPLPAFLSKEQPFTVKVTDGKRGLRLLQVTVTQSGREHSVLKRTFPFQGFFNCEGTHQHTESFTVDPRALNLAQGRAELHVQAFDQSRRGGGDGNQTQITHAMVVDTMPPSIRALTRLHYINQGGACLIIYQASSDVEKSGVTVEELSFPGYPVQGEKEKGVHTCYFAVPHDAGKKPAIRLWAEDRAGNQSRVSFYHQVREKRFRQDRMNITDVFLERILPYFSSVTFEPDATPVEKYLKINNDLRKENDRILKKLPAESVDTKLWDGTWLRLRNAATMAQFADHRTYYYKGNKVDEKDHLGVDLASLANSPVPAANHGRVLFAGELGIYGKAVVLDHGQGLTSLYGHLSSIRVSKGQDVQKGDILGATGSTGLAGGDHLHFSILVNGVFVNPIEWWDGHWIRDNIQKKMALLSDR
jgi:murein DD-endopeptidase MepM/ murein hydrolase activator NlpD